jgi:hypothetical protein
MGYAKIKTLEPLRLLSYLKYLAFSHIKVQDELLEPLFQRLLSINYTNTKKNLTHLSLNIKITRR